MEDDIEYNPYNGYTEEYYSTFNTVIFFVILGIFIL